MKQFFLTVLGVFTGLILFVVVVPVVLILGAAATAQEPATPANAVLELDLREGLSDQASNNPFAAFNGGGLSVMQIVDALAQAEKDTHVKVLLIRLPEAGISPASADEIRQAVRRFRAAGKPVIAHSQGFQPVGTVISSYMIGASASELWMQNTANFQATGFSADTVFLGRAFERYGVNAQFEQRYEYKNAVNDYTQSDYTGPHREAMTAWMTSIYDSAIANAALDRKVTAPALKTVIEAGPYSAAQALSLKLIDKIGQVEEAEAEAKRRAGQGADILAFSDYAASKGERVGSGRDAIAIIGGEGAIVTGAGGDASFSGGSSIYSDETAEALYDAIEDSAVKAIVFRVSSPGGSDTASEQILAAVKAAKAKGKPVVVSMGTYAASGGYWISSQASSIVAQPSTLTGSIGVFGGKFAIGEALARFGIDMRQTHVGGEYSETFGSAQAFKPAQRAAFSAWMDHIYNAFVARVAEGRKLPAERVREIAKGRVWTGEQAKALGLVDQVGGFYDAVDRAKALAEIKGAVHLKTFGGPQSPFESLERLFGATETSVRVLAAAAWVMGDPNAKAILDDLADARLRSQGAAVLAPRSVH